MVRDCPGTLPELLAGRFRLGRHFEVSLWWLAGERKFVVAGVDSLWTIFCEKRNVGAPNRPLGLLAANPLTAWSGLFARDSGVDRFRRLWILPDNVPPAGKL